jgi:hypothetical protein
MFVCEGREAGVCNVWNGNQDGSIAQLPQAIKSDGKRLASNGTDLHMVHHANIDLTNRCKSDSHMRDKQSLR